MRSFSWTLLVVLLAGCAYHLIPVSVYAKNGTRYQAPTLCAALVECMKDGAPCYYDSTKVITAVGGIEESPICKEVQK